ncbi:MAG: hypothetical protein ABEI97_02660, partial [Candidatus Nanohaloarchaea archaeon]
MLWDDDLKRRVKEVRREYYGTIDSLEGSPSSADYHWKTVVGVFLSIIYILVLIGTDLITNSFVSVLSGVFAGVALWKAREKEITAGYVIGSILLLHPGYAVLSIFGLDINAIAVMIGIGAGVLSLFQEGPVQPAGGRTPVDVQNAVFKAAALTFLPIWVAAGLNVVLSALAGQFLNTGFVVASIAAAGTSVFLFTHDNIKYATAWYIGSVSFFVSSLEVAEDPDKRTGLDKVVIGALVLWAVLATVIGLVRLTGVSDISFDDVFIS